MQPSKKLSLKKGWPLVGDTAGKVIIILDQFETQEYYINNHSNLEGRVAFPYYSWENRNNTNAVILKINVPSDTITLAVEMGYLVRTRADMWQPTFPIANQTALDQMFYNVIDRDQDGYLSQNELVQWQVYGATNDVQDWTTSRTQVSSYIAACCSTCFLKIKIIINTIFIGVRTLSVIEIKVKLPVF